ncbi:macrophage mannose receptor 1-like [Colossoma macropomum]|uniref:macrophage mannose receptor 1-like n=1 Tax=Colossoma macropomum TaxID=42526 RepID=UPI001864D645|nr:macrophage mannose receptor 1-like [Colossoma macropomum]
MATDAIFLLLILLPAFTSADQNDLGTPQKSMTQSEAREACRANHTDLVTDEDNAALTNLTNMTGISGAWIGLYRSYKWSNGDNVTFSNLTGDCRSECCCAAMKADGSWERLQCTEKRNFMCYKQDTDLTLNYYLISENMSWYEAQSYCRKNYTDLVGIRDQNQNEAVKTEGLKNSTSFWIGLLHDDWEWTDGGHSAYRNWATDQPRSSSDCATLRKGKWEGVPCSNTQPALCYSIVCPADQSCLRTFHIIEKKMNRSEARAACRANYTDLVTVYNDDNNTALTNLAGNGTAWIGLCCSQSVRDKWSNGDNVTFSNLTGVCGSESCCAAMKADGSWESLNCTEKRNVMCYKQDQIYLKTFHVIQKSMNQSEAQAACRTNYTDLVTVYSDEDNAALTNLINMTGITKAWIGLYRTYKWSNGDNVTFSNLTGVCGSECCCAAMKADGSWERLNCTEQRNFMCYKQDTDVTVSYYLIFENMSWSEAQSYCRKNYTDLVSIRDQNQNEAVKIEGLNSSTSFWIGLLRDDWQWTDEGRSAYRNWATGPSRSTSDCVTLKKLKWETVPYTDNQSALSNSTSSIDSMSNENALPFCNKDFSPAGQSRLRTFHAIGNKQNYSEARVACRTNYTDLVTVYHDEDNTLLKNIGSAWIGLYRNDKWSNGDDVTFSKLTGDCGSGPCCAAMKADDAWESVNCTIKRNFMCYKQDVTDLTLNYHVILKPMSWYEAQSYCRKNYTDLVSIRNQNQNEAVKIKGLNSSTPFWIGLLHDDWEWTDGGHSAYRNWATSQPEPLPSQCVKLLSGKWYSEPCSNMQCALCYRTFIHVSNDSMSWEDALDYCKKDNRAGFLRIQSESDQKEVEFELRRRRVSGTLWVGLAQSQLFGFWIWTDGIGVGPWTNWLGGRQPEPPLSHHCGAIDIEEDFKWTDNDCRSKFRVLCEVKSFN